MLIRISRIKDESISERWNKKETPDETPDETPGQVPVSRIMCVINNQ